MPNALYSGLTASAIRAACAESGASEMLVSPALVLALLDAAEQGRELRDAVEVVGNHYLYDCESDYLAGDGNTAARGSTPAEALIALASKKGWESQ